jgi:hypothetical protein
MHIPLQHDSAGRRSLHRKDHFYNLHVPNITLIAHLDNRTRIEYIIEVETSSLNLRPTCTLDPRASGNSNGAADSGNTLEHIADNVSQIGKARACKCQPGSMQSSLDLSLSAEMHLLRWYYLLCRH